MAAEVPYQGSPLDRRNFDDVDQHVHVYWPKDAPGAGYTSPRWYAPRNLTVTYVVTSIDDITTGDSTVLLYKNGSSVATITVPAGEFLVVTKLDTPVVLKKDEDYLQWGPTVVGTGASSFGFQARGK